MEKRHVVITREPKKNGTCYFLRCLWHLLNDPSSDKYIHWHPSNIDSFIIEDEKLLNAYLKSYDAFKSNWNSFRRNLYFYGFSKQKTAWKHPMLCRGDEGCLAKIKRKPKKNNSADQLRMAYMRMVLEHQMAMQMNCDYSHEISKESLSPTNWALPMPDEPTGLEQGMAPPVMMGGEQYQQIANPALGGDNVMNPNAGPAPLEGTIDMSQMAALMGGEQMMANFSPPDMSMYGIPLNLDGLETGVKMEMPHDCLPMGYSMDPSLDTVMPSGF